MTPEQWDRVQLIIGWTLLVGLEVGWVVYLFFFHDRFFPPLIIPD